MKDLRLTSFKYAAAVCAALTLAGGCGSAGPKAGYALPPELNSAVVVSVGDPDVTIPEGARFAWMAQSIRYFGDPRVDGVQFNALLQEAIRGVLEEKGYVLGTPDDCEFKVGYVAAIESGISDRDINALYGINPGWTAAEPRDAEYEKGTLIVDVIHAGTHRCAWRGSLQANVAFDLPEQIRRQRIGIAVRQLFAGFPPR